jgi:hypothetical protein
MTRRKTSKKAEAEDEMRNARKSYARDLKN